MFIKRERYLTKIRSFYEVDLIKVLTGVRRCGKSVLLTQIEEEILAQNVPHDHIIRINFEKICDSDKYYIFLDEIQHVRQFEKGLASLRATQNCSIFITGSNSKPFLEKWGRSSLVAALNFASCRFLSVKPMSM